MAKNTKQISLMQQRHGKLNELPKQLSTAQFGFADDTNRLFIGNPDHPTLRNRYESDTFPYGNVEILTEFADNLDLIKYSPYMNGEKIFYPLSIEGTVENPSVPSNSSIKINDEEIVFTPESSYVGNCDYILLEFQWEDGKDLDVKAVITNSIDPELNNQIIGWDPSLKEFEDWDDDKKQYTKDEKVIYHNGNTYICIQDYDTEVIGINVDPTNLNYWKPYQEKSFPYNTSILNSSMYWAGDIVSEATEENPLYESILISKKNLLENYRDKFNEDDINIDLSATWFKRNGDEGHMGVKPIKLKVTIYRGGVMSLIGKRFINDEKYIIKTVEYTVRNNPNEFNQYKKLASLKINKNNGSVYFEIDDLIIDNEQTVNNTVGFDNIIKQINDHFNETLVQARSFNNKLQLFTLGSSITLDNVGEQTTLETLGLVSDVYLSKPLYKRTLQEVIDDRYSIKSFEVMGDGVTNDGPSINNALRILYNTPLSDPKELYFPADVYNIVNTSLYIMTNTHLVGEGIDRTIIKGSQSSSPLMILADDNLKLANESGYCLHSEYPHNILIEDMTFDISSSSSSVIFYMNHSNNVQFRNCKFITRNNNFIDSSSTSIMNNLRFENCVFEGNTGQIIINGELDGLLITNCEFKNIQNIIVSLNGNSNLIQNGIIANNKFTNCSGSPLINVNENTKYISVVKSLVDESYFENDSKVLNRTIDENGRYTDKNYCDTPIRITDENKFLRFNFYQSIYDYVQTLYSKYGKNALEVISPNDNLDVTNYLELTQGTNALNSDEEDDTDNTILLNSTSQVGSVEFGVGLFGDLHLGKKVEKIFDWKENTLYDKMEIIKYNGLCYICVEKHKSSEIFDLTKWIQIDLNDDLTWNEREEYHKNDLVVYEDFLYRCIVENSSPIFKENEWEKLGEYKSYIILHKDLDLNSNPIENKNGSDITFKVNNDNYIVIDESNSSNEKPYSERLGRFGNALTTVDYVTEMVNSGDKLIYNADKINTKITEENPSLPEITIMNFDTNKYGNEVYLKDVFLNIRQLFMPINEQKKLKWDNRVYKNQLCVYNIGDEIKIENPNTGSFEYYKCRTAHTASYDPAKNLYDNFRDDSSDWDSQSQTGNEKDYAIYEKVIYEYLIYDIICIFNPNSVLYEYYICKQNHYASYDPSKSDYDNFITDINYWEEITNYDGFINYILPKNYNENDKIKIFNEYTQETEYYICKQNHEESYDPEKNLYDNFMSYMEDYWERVDLNKAFYYTIFDYSNICWYKGDVVSFNNKYYICKEDHQASALANPEISFMNDYNYNRWEEVDVNDSEKDLRYIGLKIVDNNNNEIDKWIYDVKDVDLVVRDTQGFNYPRWKPNTTYNYGDIASFNYTNYKCVSKNNSGDHISHTYYGNDDNAEIDLHSINNWKALSEPGYDYEYHFERTLLIKDDDTSNGFYMNLINEDYQLDHNVANHKIKLCLYDDEGKPLEIKSYDTSKYFEIYDNNTNDIANWQPNKTYYQGQYVKNENNYYCCNITHTSKNNFEDDMIDPINGNISGQSSSEQNRREYFVDATDLYDSDTHKFVWNENHTYAEGQHVIYNNAIYVSTKYHNAMTFEDEIKNGNLERAIEKYCQLSYSGDMIISIHFRKEKN